jgi:predicted nucleic acid-binding protein
MSNIVLDTCCLVNLYASGHFADILSSPSVGWHVPEAVEKEAMFVRERNSRGAVELRAVQLQEHFAAKLLQRCAPKGEEEAALFVRLAMDLEDGEAMALAIAGSRRWNLATDDAKARRWARGLGVKVVTTPEVMRDWQRTTAVDDDVVRSALARIETSANFVPSDSFPEAEWWRSFTQGGED